MPAADGRLNLCFFGTPSFAVPSLERLALSPVCRVLAVVTQCDRPAGRGMALRASPVKETALRLSLPCLQPEDVNRPEFTASLRVLGADLFVVIAFGQKFGPEILALPPLGCINAHASLLPRHRGASPIQTALMCGDTETGVDVIFMNDRMDAGNVLLSAPLPIAPEDTAGTLTEKLSQLSAVQLEAAARSLLENPRKTGTPQDESKKTLSRKITPQTGRLDFSRPARDLNNLVRALNPHPGAFALLPLKGQTRTVKIWETCVEEPCCAAPGAVVRADARGILLGTGSGGLLVKRLQLDSGKQLSAEQFLCGHRLNPGDLFQTPV